VGQVFPFGHRRGDRAREAAPARLVQGDTSTTMLQPLDEVGAICAKHGVLFYSDATASLGGNAFEADAGGWMPRPPACRNAWAARRARRRSRCPSAPSR
jgi:hypothetical protein